MALPAGHGLPSGEITVAPGESEEHGNIVLSCPAGGQACVLNVADDGSASYARTGGMPSIMPAFAAQTLPPGHGLGAGQISVAAGASMEHGNVVVSCPAGGNACILNVAADGSAAYDKTGAMPSIMTASAAQTLPPGHGLTEGEITVAAGASMEHGNVVVSCPAGGNACILNVAADGSASYDRTGGIPGLQISPLTPGPGLKLSDVSPIFARDEASTLSATLADPANVVPAIAATVNRRRASGQEGTELATDFFVKSIRRNASGAYVIDYVSDGVDEQVIMPLDDCPNGCRVTVNGRTFSFYAQTADDDDTATTEDGLGEFEYMASHRTFFFFRPDDDLQARHLFLFGVRNEHLPMGTATYHGSMRVRTLETANDDLDQRQRIRGVMRIVANFDMRALEGRVYRIEGAPRGASSSDRTDWPTSSFMITNGRIVNGQFTATLTGVDSDPNTPFDESLRDFMGHVLGEFYGPNAEEVGALLTATRDVAGTADDRVLYGWLLGRKTDRLTASDSGAHSSGVDRDFTASSTVLAAIETPAVESTAHGYRITYTIDGQATTLDLSESDFGSNPTSSSRATRYDKEVDGVDHILWDETRSFESTRSFLGRFRPEHFDVNGLAIVHRDALDDATSAVYSYLVYGNRTADMPTTGTANYSGGFRAREWPTDDALGSDNANVRFYQGDFNLSADFGGSAVTGNATNIQSRPGNSGASWGNVSGGLSFNATISGNGLSATDLSGSRDLAGYSGGRVSGAFYGPAAKEAAGVFDATHDATQNTVLHGYFGAQKQ
ncbi:MAG: transferrin-binding protein-like solute binding protein [Gemmatimonadetes bacterium]|nr:transferrin-binding protein-like solute binding protein [Gemmatimonadota bacterium]